MHEKRAALRDEAGFTLLELLVVVGAHGRPGRHGDHGVADASRGPPADAGLEQAIDAMRSAREVAISQRRNVELRFVGSTALQTVREDIGVGGVQTGTTILRTVELENRMQFRLDPDVPDDTPDRFPAMRPATRSRSGSDGDSRMFTSEGTFVDQTATCSTGRCSSRFRVSEQRAGDHGHGRDGADSVVAMERQRVGGVSAWRTRPEPDAAATRAGFSLIETMIAMAILATGC